MNDTPLRRRLNMDSTEIPAAERSVPTPFDNEPVESDVATTNVRGVVRDLLETALFILLVFFIVRGIVQNFKIEGQSMEPTLHNAQYILVNKLIYFHFDLNAPMRLLPGQNDLPSNVVYLFHEPQRGDIVVFEYPNDVKKDYIKRVIGLPGDEVYIHDSKVFVNGHELAEPYLEGAPTVCEGYKPCGQGPIKIAAGTIFVMGDNRRNSSDSREWDSLPLERLIGQAAVLYYPFKDWGLIPTHTYASDQ